MLRIVRISVALLVVWVIALTTTACSTANVAKASKPVVVITAPPSNSQFTEGDNVIVQSTVTDSVNIVQVTLVVDGAIVKVDTPATGQSFFSIAQTWTAKPGNHTLVVNAVNANGAVSNPVGISISVSPAATPLPSSTPTLPTLVPTATPGLPTLTPIPTATATDAPTTIAATACPLPQIASFTVNPTEIKKGDSATLNWGTVTNANSATIDNGIGGIPAPGSRQVRPDKNTTYTLTATGCGGTSTAQTTVSVFAIGPLYQGIPEGPRSFQPTVQFNWSNRSGYDGDKYLSNIEIEIERNGSYQPFETKLNFELQGNGHENKTPFPQGKYKIRFRWWMSDRNTKQRVSPKSAWSVICFNYKDNETCR